LAYSSSLKVRITLDNATNNDKFMDFMQVYLTSRDIPFSALKNRIRCFAHIINIAVQHILEIVNPPRRRQIDPLSDNLDNDDQQPRNALAKLIKIVVAVRSSGQRRDAFKQEILLGNEQQRWRWRNEHGQYTVI
jgi:hypothetical protein